MLDHVWTLECCRLSLCQLQAIVKQREKPHFQRDHAMLCPTVDLDRRRKHFHVSRHGLDVLHIQ